MYADNKNVGRIAASAPRHTQNRGVKRRGAFIALAFLLAALVISACAPAEERPAPRFSTGASVEVASSTLSLSLYSECGSTFTKLVGLANSGDAARIRARKFCSDDWWYEIQVEALRSSDWRGIGWVREANLTLR